MRNMKISDFVFNRADAWHTVNWAMHICWGDDDVGCVVRCAGRTKSNSNENRN